MANPITKIILSAVDRTKAGIASARAGIDSIGTSASNLKSLLGSVFTGLSVTAFIGQIKQAADEMDNALKSAQASGTSLKNFSALSYASGQSGGGPEVLQKSLIKLVQSLDQSSDSASDAAATWRSLGIDPKQFDDPADALLAIAERFAAMPDGIRKTNLAVDLFGEKIGPKMIPLLNQGREGINGLTDEAQRLGKVLDDDVAKAAERFNDTLDRLNARKVSLFSKALPSLEQYVSALDDIIERGSAFDKIAFFTTGFINEETLNRISDAGERVQDYNAEIFKLQQQLLELQRVELAGSPNIKIWEARIDALSKTRATLIAAEKKANADRVKNSDKTSESIIKNYDEESKAFRKSADERISDAERLQSALQSAFSQALGEEDQYNKEAKKLRTKADTQGAGERDQSDIRFDANIADMKLSRLTANGTADEIRDQAAAVKDLASALNDQEYSSYLVRRATIAEAQAAEKSAAEAGERAKGLAEQMAANEARLAGYNKVVEAVSKPVAINLTPTEQTEASLAKLREAKELIEFINETPVKANVSAVGADAAVGTLRTTALQYGRRN